MRRSLELKKKSQKTTIIPTFKAIDGCSPGKLVSSACYNKQPANLCLSATVITLDELIVVK